MIKINLFDNNFFLQVGRVFYKLFQVAFEFVLYQFFPHNYSFIFLIENSHFIFMN